MGNRGEKSLQNMSKIFIKKVHTNQISKQIVIFLMYINMNAIYYHVLTIDNDIMRKYYFQHLVNRKYKETTL